jgi:hypothetical protein
VLGIIRRMLAHVSRNRGGDSGEPSLSVDCCVALLSVTPAPADSCEALTNLSLPATTITLAESVNSAGWPVAVTGRTGSHSPFCRIAATLKTTADSDIKVEV